MKGGGRDFVQKPWDNDKLLSTLRRQIEEGRVLREKKREMQDARNIQQRLLPAESPRISGCEIHCYWKPAEDVGGDYFDAIRLTDASAAFCIADVAGKGMPAALLMSNMQASVRGLAHSVSSPAEMCTRLNRVALDNTRSNRFTTFFYGILDSGRCSLRYCNAGHLPPILVRQDGGVLRLSDGGVVLGVFPDAAYAEAEVPFIAGDRLLLVTDGITEAMNAADEEFGEDRVIGLLVEHRGRSAAELQRILVDEVELFAGRGLRDDATLMIISNGGAAVGSGPPSQLENRCILQAS
jgi:sigma-B regulation protein RsbU (phosphoserine phosphatase)